MIFEGNNIITLLSLPEWDERILTMLEEFNEERPTLNNIDKSTHFTEPTDYFISLNFDEQSLTDKQKENAKQGNIYLNQITLKEKTPLKLPFGIKMGDSYFDIEKKIGLEANFINEYLPTQVQWILRDEDKDYEFFCIFNNENFESLVKIFMRPLDKEANYMARIPFKKPKK